MTENKTDPKKRGRKKSPAGTKTVSRNISFPPKVLKIAELEAERRETSLSKLIAIALREEILRRYEEDLTPQKDRLTTRQLEGLDDPEASNVSRQRQA